MRRRDTTTGRATTAATIITANTSTAVDTATTAATTIAEAIRRAEALAAQAVRLGSGRVLPRSGRLSYLAGNGSGTDARRRVSSSGATPGPRPASSGGAGSALPKRV